MDFKERIDFRHSGWIWNIVEPLESRFVNVFVDIHFGMSYTAKPLRDTEVHVHVHKNYS